VREYIVALQNFTTESRKKVKVDRLVEHHNRSHKIREQGDAGGFETAARGSSGDFSTSWPLECMQQPKCEHIFLKSSSRSIDSDQMAGKERLSAHFVPSPCCILTISVLVTFGQADIPEYLSLLIKSPRSIMGYTLPDEFIARYSPVILET
jgi:hypothetical protein